MKFALCYAYDPTQTGPSEAEIADWMAFDQAVKDTGVFVYEAGFHAATAAQTVRVRDARATVENKATANTSHALAGLYVLDVTNHQDALTWAQQIPTAKYGQVEVREIVEF